MGLVLLLRMKENNVKPMSGLGIGENGMFKGRVAVRRPSAPAHQYSRVV
jgi:hypothetical protein